MAKKASASKSKKPDSAVTDAARLHVWHIQAVRDVLFVVAIIAIIWFGYALSAVTVPLLVSLLLAYLFEPLIDRLCKHKKITRVRAVIGILATVGIAVAIVLAVAIPLLVTQTIQLVNYVTDGELRRDSIQITQRYLPDNWQDDVLRIAEMFPEREEPKSRNAEPPTIGPPEDGTDDDQPVTAIAQMNRDELNTLVQEQVAAALAGQSSGESDEDTLTVLKRNAQAAWEYILWMFRILGGVVQAGLTAFLIPFYFFFFSLWYPSVVRFGRGLIPEKNKRRTLDLLGKMDLVVSGFVRGRIIISLIMGVLLAIGWMICGVPFAVPVGLVVGIFCAVPYLGAVGVPLAVGLLFFDTLKIEDKADLWWLWVLLWPSVVFGVVQLIEAYVLTPMIAGKVTGLDPVTILVAVLAGGSVLGMYGMILAIPLAACGKIAFTELLLPRIRDWTEGKISDPLPIDRA